MQSYGLFFSLYLEHYQHNYSFFRKTVFYCQNLNFQVLSGHYQALYKASEYLNGGNSVVLHVIC
jgi:hypothetical protein